MHNNRRSVNTYMIFHFKELLVKLLENFKRPENFNRLQELSGLVRLSVAKAADISIS